MEKPSSVWVVVVVSEQNAGDIIKSIQNLNPQSGLESETTQRQGIGGVVNELYPLPAVSDPLPAVSDSST